MKQTVFGYTGDESECVCCGEYIPEGRQVCIDCEQKAKLGFGKSETLIIGFDSSNGEDLSALSVARHMGSKLISVNTFYGEEAEWMYSRLTNVKI